VSQPSAPAPRSDALTEGLNPPQREAVLHGAGPMLVLAGAGSGKTRVLTHRVARLVGEEGVHPGRILAITFTNKAAGEMRERISSLVGPSARSIWAGTFHATCVRILRRDADRLGYARDFVIYDADDQLRLLRACLLEEQIDPKRFPARAAQAAISDQKSRLRDAEQVSAEAGSFTEEQVGRVYRRYADRLRANQAMDFDDLLMLTVRLLEQDDEARLGWQRRFQHVLVDEYQDTNHAQYRLVRVLGEPERNVCVVGDDDQGIYSWRGADVRNILDFTRDYPDAAVIALEQNYRSTGTILRAANAVVARNSGRHPKELWTDAGDGGPIIVAGCRDEHEEARLVAAEVDGALARGESLANVAVFYRTNAQSRVIEDQLVRRSIAYQVVGGPRFYERSEIRDVLAYLRVATNPSDAVSLARMMGAPKRGVGPAAIARLGEHAAMTGRAIAELLPLADEVPGINAGPRAALREAGALMGEIRQQEAAGAHLGHIIEHVIDRSGLRANFEAEGTIEAQGRLENLEELISVAAEHAPAVDERPLPAFLERVALESDADTVDEATGQVTLMTIHNAKGLEFQTVVITGLEEMLFPHVRSDTPEALEEERRLFYVGMTRARQRLVLAHAETRALHGSRDYRIPSRFLSEVPSDAITIPEGARRSNSAGAASVMAGRAGVERVRAAAPALATGDAVVHATFGEGIVTGVEGRGDLVRVRFANDGSERRLMAGAAPMRRLEAE
jgi:DNA helicase-2/ATP-dependent DNA helicase PcrA